MRLARAAVCHSDFERRANRKHVGEVTEKVPINANFSETGSNILLSPETRQIIKDKPKLFSPTCVAGDNKHQFLSRLGGSKGDSLSSAILASKQARVLLPRATEHIVGVVEHEEQGRKVQTSMSCGLNVICTRQRRLGREKPCNSYCRTYIN